MIRSREKGISFPSNRKVRKNDDNENVLSRWSYSQWPRDISATDCRFRQHLTRWRWHEIRKHAWKSVMAYFVTIVRDLTHDEGRHDLPEKQERASRYDGKAERGIFSLEGRRSKTRELRFCLTWWMKWPNARELDVRCDNDAIYRFELIQRSRGNSRATSSVCAVYLGESVFLLNRALLSIDRRFLRRGK